MVPEANTLLQAEGVSVPPGTHGTSLSEPLTRTVYVSAASIHVTCAQMGPTASSRPCSLRSIVVSKQADQAEMREPGDSRVSP